MDFRLLIDADVLDFLQGVPGQQRRRLYLYFREIQKYPANYSKSKESDEVGRILDVALYGTFRIYYWTDAADGHIKILKVRKMK